MADQLQIIKQDDGSYKVSINRTVPQVEEHVFGSLDEAVAKIKEIEQAEQPQG